MMKQQTVWVILWYKSTIQA